MALLQAQVGMMQIPLQQHRLPQLLWLDLLAHNMSSPHGQEMPPAQRN
jgi:hypothetical protein